MKFTFDIPDDDLYGYDTVREYILDKAARYAADNLMQIDAGHEYSSVEVIIRETIKNKEKEIIDAAVKRVSDSIAKKKSIVAITPKARDIAAADKDNEKYFTELIDRAIAKRFSGK